MSAWTFPEALRLASGLSVAQRRELASLLVREVDVA